MNFFQQVYDLTRLIPAGSVTTYGELARALGTRDARRVGHALHASAKGRSAYGRNPQPVCPCHRVVDREGRLAPRYAFGGDRAQYSKLKSEGITFTNSHHVNLPKHFFRFSEPLTI